MSQQLPETADEMLQISHVTKANFEKYGEGLLKICQQHAADRKGEMLELIDCNAYPADQPTKQCQSLVTLVMKLKILTQLNEMFGM
jgi:hypothetical protein